MRKYEALSGLVRLSWPRECSEFEIHAGLYAKLRWDGFAVRGAIVGPATLGVRIVPDLAVFNHAEGRCVAIIEVKKSERSDLYRTRQGKRYRSCGVPVFLFWHAKDYPELKRELAAIVARSAY